LDQGAVGCVYGSDEALDAAANRLLSLGLAADALHVGAADSQRAHATAQRIGIRADVLPDDPLQHILAAGQNGDARSALDRAGMIGGLVGAAAGVAISFTPAGSVLFVPPAAHVLANVGLYFVLGAIVGSVLGAALAPQPSTHAGFRLIDGMQEGSYALIVVAPRRRLDELQHILQASGGTGITRV
jgi:hypothetical protein